MAYKTGTAISIEEVLNQLAYFAEANGWELVVFDSKMPTLPAVSNGLLANNPRYGDNSALIAVQRAVNIKRYTTMAAESPEGARLVIKDPNGAYFHIFGFGSLNGWVDGEDGQALSCLEVWVSDIWNGHANPVNAHGVVKLGSGGPYRKKLTGFHFFTGQNQYNNKLYFNIVLETIPDSYEHFCFGAIETYLDMDCGEFWQGSGQSAGSYRPQDPYSLSATQLAYYPAVCNSLGCVHGNGVLASYDLILNDTSRRVAGNFANVDMLSSMLVRYSLPQFNREKALLCSNLFDTKVATAASVGRTNEFMAPPFTLAGKPVYGLTPNDYSGVSVFTPVYVTIYNPQENDHWGLIGHFPNQRMCNLANNNPQDVVIYGEDEWMLFPLHKKGPATYDGTWPVVSGNYGIAYKK